MNVFSFVGNLGGDAEIRTVGQTGQQLASFSVAVKSGFGDKAHTTWVRCAMWGERGTKVAPYIKKGDRIGVTGEAFLHSYEKRDGSAVTELNVRVNDVTLLGDPKGGSNAKPNYQDDIAGGQHQPDRHGSLDEQPDFEDDIPF